MAEFRSKKSKKLEVQEMDDLRDLESTNFVAMKVKIGKDNTQLILRKKSSGIKTSNPVRWIVNRDKSPRMRYVSILKSQANPPHNSSALSKKGKRK